MTERYIIDDKKDMKKFSRQVIGDIKSIYLDAEAREIWFNMEEGTCVDARRSQELAESIMPNVLVIITQTPTKIDTCYALKTGRWEMYFPLNWKKARTRR